jgi:hypothetical protein
MSSENSLSFFGAGGHSHNGVNSTLIDTTRYSIFDFSLGFVGSQARINSQSVKQRSFEDYVIRIINSQVLQPAGLSLDPDTLNGKTIRANTITSTEIQAGTITANELTSNIVLVNNIIRSTNFDGTFHANGVISNSGTVGWGISYAGSSVFSNTVIRGTVTSTSGRIGPFDITDTSFRSNGYSPRNFMKIENFGDVTISSQPSSGAHLDMIHRTDLVGEYILIEREGVTGRRAVMGSPDGNPNGMEFGLVDDGTQRFLAKTDGTIFASGAISGASLAVTGAITGASLATTGAISGASLAATGNITGSVAFLAGGFPSAGNNTGFWGSVPPTFSAWGIVASYNFFNPSDGRFKDNQKELPLGLSFINKLQPIEYTNLAPRVVKARLAKEGEEQEEDIFEWDIGSRLRAGFTAQNVKEALISEDVGDYNLWSMADKNDPDSYQMLDYTQLIAPVVQAIKEIDIRLRSLEDRLKAFEGV